MGSRDKFLDADEICQLLALVRQLHALSPAGDGRRVRMLQGICDLVEADAAESAIAQVNGTGVRLWSPVRVARGGGAPRAVLSGRIGGREVTDPAVQRLLAGQRARRAGGGGAVTRTRRELVADGEWYETPFVAEVRRRAGLDDGVYSALPLGSAPSSTGRVSAVLCVARAWGASGPAMGARESWVTQLVHAESGWVYEGTAAATDAAGAAMGLSPRQRECLQGLLRGRSEREVAGDLRLSPHTVHAHVKAIYRALGVTTRAELMARYVSSSAPGGRRAGVATASKAGL